MKKNHIGEGSTKLTTLWGKTAQKEADHIKEINATLIAEACLSVNFFDKPPVKKWLQDMGTTLKCEKLATIGSSARSIGRYQEELVCRFKEIIRSKGKTMAKKGLISLQADHFHSAAGTKEKSRSYLGVIICVRDSNYSLVKAPLAYKPAKSHTFLQFRIDLKEILEVGFLI